MIRKARTTYPCQDVTTRGLGRIFRRGQDAHAPSDEPHTHSQLNIVVLRLRQNILIVLEVTQLKSIVLKKRNESAEMLG
jgi:hypothetical protein